MENSIKRKSLDVSARPKDNLTKEISHKSQSIILSTFVILILAGWVNLCYVSNIFLSEAIASSVIILLVVIIKQISINQQDKI